MIKYLRTSFALVCLVIVGCADSPSPETLRPQKEPPGTPIVLTAAQVKIIQAGVRRDLKDPDSAKFGNQVLAAKRINGDITACGTVNAKNSYGGYVGESPFIATFRDGKVIDTATASGRDAKFVIELCRDAGVPI
jgi:hypothetical protein